MRRVVWEEPGVSYFKPAGIRMRELKEVVIPVEEYEALRLKDLESLEQKECAEKMSISQPTFHRLLTDARKKVAKALVKGLAIKIQGGNFELAQKQEIRRVRRGRRFGRFHKPFK